MAGTISEDASFLPPKILSLWKNTRIDTNLNVLKRIKVLLWKKRGATQQKLCKHFILQAKGMMVSCKESFLVDLHGFSSF